jgi:hypothetical protein
MSAPGQGYDPREDPELDEDQREEALNRLSSWFAFFRDADDLHAFETRLPDSDDRWKVLRAWAFANDKATNGLLTEADTQRLFGSGRDRRRFTLAGVIAKHAAGFRLVDYLRVNFPRGRQKRAAVIRSAVSAIGGRKSGLARQELKKLRSARNSSTAAQNDERTTGTGTGTGTRTDTQTDANADAPASAPSGLSAGDEVSEDQGGEWLHIDSIDIQDFIGLERLHVRAVQHDCSPSGVLGFFELVALTMRAYRLGKDPKAWLASALNRWRDEPGGLGLAEMDRDQALAWLARVRPRLAHEIAEALRIESMQVSGGIDGCDEWVDVEYRRRLAIIANAKAKS